MPLADYFDPVVQVQLALLELWQRRAKRDEVLTFAPSVTLDFSRHEKLILSAPSDDRIMVSGRWQAHVSVGGAEGLAGWVDITIELPPWASATMAGEHVIKISHKSAAARSRPTTDRKAPAAR